MPDSECIANQELQSIKHWYPILKWPELPNFSSCHNIDNYTKFIDYYYVCAKLSLLEENISELLRTGVHTSSIRLMGAPGAGKTTFLYYMMKKAIHEASEIYNQYHFFVFHANKANKEDEYEQLVMEKIKDAWKAFFIACSQNGAFRALNSRQDLTLKGELNWLADYYTSNKSLFNKNLIFIIDDVDTMSNSMALNIAKSVRTHLEVQSVIKWISIRDETFTNYPKETKIFFEQFFPEVQKVPTVSLHAIMKYRIETCANGTGKNPYTEDLCDSIVENLCDHNKRQSLPLLCSILADAPPKGIGTSASQEFIQKYVEKNSVNTLIEREFLINLHLPSLRNLVYPVAYDIMRCLAFTQSKRVLFAAVRQAAIVKSKKSNVYPPGRAIDLKFSQYEYCLEKLERQNLFSINQDSIELTKKGKVHGLFIASDNYNEKCLNRIPKIDRNDDYEDLLNRGANYKAIVMEFTSKEYD